MHNLIYALAFLFLLLIVSTLAFLPHRRRSRPDVITITPKVEMTPIEQLRSAEEVRAAYSRAGLREPIIIVVTNADIATCLFD